jgi:tetratricopeptide (TPR) repeat protein
MELDPSNASVLLWRGVHLLSLGQAEEALALHTRAVEIDPLDMSVRTLLCRALYLAKRYDDAIKTGRELIAIDGNQSAAHQWIGLSLAALGRSDEGLGSLQYAVKLSRSSERLASLAYGYALAKRTRDVREIISELEKPRVGVGNAYHIATVYAGLGDQQQALRWLERALRERDGFVPNRLMLDPKLDTLRDNPRFKAVLEAIQSGNR